MFPASLIALVLFAASIGPGYVWVRYAERRTPRAKRSGLMEAAELVVIGGTFSVVAIALGLAVIDRTSLVSLTEIDALGSGYVIRHPFRSLVTLALVLSIAYGLSYGSALLFHRGRRASIDHGYSAWYFALERSSDHDVYVTVDLRTGDAVAGWVLYYTVAEVPHTERDLVLAPARGMKLQARKPGHSEVEEISEDFVVLNGAEIVSVSGQYVLKEEPAPGQLRHEEAAAA